MHNSRLLRIAGLFLGVLVWLANATNPPTGKTGAPFSNEGHCNECHSGNLNGYNGNVEVTGMPSSVDPNTTYPLTITLTPTAGTPIRGGFQLVVVDGNNVNAGDLTAGNGQSGTEFFSSREYLEHRSAKLFTGGGPASWTFNWKSPVSASGNTIKFYFIGNFTNNNNNDTGDFPIAASETYTFNGPPPLAASITEVNNVLCFGGNTGSITVDASGGLTPYTYHWSNNQSTATAVNLTAGTYTVTVTGASGSGTVTASAVVSQPPQINLSTSVSGILNCVNTAVTATATTSGGTPGYSHDWSDGTNGPQAVLSSPGVYTVTVTDANGCTKTSTVTVVSNTTPPTAEAGPPAAITCAQPTVALNGAGSSSGPTFTYLWTGPSGGIVSGATTLSPVVNAAGAYTLTVTNTNNGCTSTDITTVTSTIQPPTVSATGGILTCAVNSTSISATTNATSPTFSWAGPGGFSSTAQSPTATLPGTYTVTVTNTATGCSNTATASVTQNTTPPTATASAAGFLTCSTTSVVVNGSSNAAGATFLWSGPNNFTSTAQNPSATVPGIYTMVATNPANGCTASDTAVVSQNITAPSATATSGGTLTCSTTTVSLNGSSNASGATYSWSGPNNYSSTQQNPAAIMPGVYTMIVTNPANGCTGSDTAVVSQNTAAPTVNASAAGQINCVNSSVLLNAVTNASPAQFSWSGPGGFTSSQQNPSTSVPGAYTVLVTDNSNGCTGTAGASVIENTTPPLAVATVPGNLNCNVTSMQLNGTASSQGTSFQYNWTTPNGNITAGATTLTPTVNTAGMYILAVANTANGCTASDTAVVNQTPAVSVAISNVTNVSCNNGSNGSVTAMGIGGAGAFTYVWSSGAMSATASNLPMGTYAVTATDSENCTSTSFATISQPPALFANATATGETAAGAANGTATAAPSGGVPNYTYLWSTTATTNTITNLAPGNYTVSVTDANGCLVVQTVTVNSFNCALSATIASTNASCFGANNGTATANVTGAALPVSYLWSNGGTTQMVTSLAPGMYTVQITDANNCPAALSVSISEPTLLLANATATNQTAVGQNNGTASAQPTGGTMPYTYEWSNNSTSQTISNLSPGTYTVSVQDGNNCTAVQTVVVNAFNCTMTSAISATNVSCNGGNDGQATAIPTGGVLPIAYAWSNNTVQATAANLAAGTYTVTITDAAGCFTTSSVSITEPAVLNAAAENIVPASCPESQNGSAVVTATGGTAPYLIAWPNNSGGQNLGVGTYTVSITDAKGCTTTQSVIIASNDTTPPLITCPVVSGIICAGTAVQFTQPAVSDDCNLNGAQPQLISGLPSGSVFPVGQTIQVFQVSDVSGNKASCSFTIAVTAPAEIVLNGFTPDVDNAGVGTISVTVSGGAGPYTFAWSKEGQPYATTEDLSGLKAGTYTLVVTDANGCTASLAPVKIDNTVDTHAPAAPFTLQLRPNPARHQLRLELTGIKAVDVRIVDIHGRMISMLNADEWSNAIDVSTLASGLYYLRVQLENGQSRMIKWIKSG